MTVSRRNLEFKLRANKIRLLVMHMIHKAASGHPGPSLSCVEIILALYDHILRHKPADPLWEKRDRFVLSKGHAAPTLYAVLAMHNYIKETELDTLRQAGSRLQGHPDMTMLDCIEFTTGSLGKGISAANGIAEALRVKCGIRPGKQKYACDYAQEVPFVYALIGDGELDEGITQEAIAYAGANRLNNVCVVVDNNGHQLSGKKETVLDTGPVENHFDIGKWHVVTRYKGGADLNGHDFNHIMWAFNEAQKVTDRPSALIFKTIKGKGVAFMEDDAAYHGVPPMDDEMTVLTRKYTQLQLSPTKPDIGIFDIYERIIKHRLEERDKASTIDFQIKPQMAPRTWIGKGIAAAAETDERVVGVYADLRSSCKGNFLYERFPERCFEAGIAENSMNMLAAGLAKEGFVPFTNSFSIFHLESLGALRQIAYNNLNVKVMASHGDPRLKDGGTHTEVSLLGGLRAMPNWTLFWPSDGVQAYRLVDHVIQTPGPCFIKYSRNKVPTIYNGEKLFNLPLNNRMEALDVAQGFHLLLDFRPGEGKRRITIMAMGDLVYECLKAAASMEEHGDVNVRVVDLFRLKPINRDIIIKSAQQGPIVTAEANNIHACLHGAVCEVTAQELPCTVVPIGMRDHFAKSGSYEKLTVMYNLDYKAIGNACYQALKREKRF